MNWFMLANELIQHSRNTSIATAVNIKNVVLAVLSLAWKDWKRKASNFPPEVAFQLYPFHWYDRM